ncbi:hypothetical protein HanHA300_Chr10g0355181 [Helianthus annuus]|nr:hypothetical protein HanHA300_Chr10g0355181 [Helianthus annuus]KAJ0529667.1 hypothetical protein HanHA89_Chr10g0380601 [Helianthus annuus]KAJ0700011.1 hypothetical protein HanOQP8_Chr10g0362701 [Helianthus annuus]
MGIRVLSRRSLFRSLSLLLPLCNEDTGQVTPALIFRGVTCSPRTRPSLANLNLTQLVNFGTKFPFKLGMMWHPQKIDSHHLNSLLHSPTITWQISGRNFFQVGDDVTTCIFRLL